MRTPLIHRGALAGLAGACALLAGCVNESQPPTTRPSSIRERQDQAMRDPMNYRPDMGHEDISGGGVGDLDRDALRRDMKTLFDP